MTRVLALVVNPVAGLGGPAGLKGSDGEDVQRVAVARGARSRVAERAAAALRVLAASEPAATVITAAGSMGEDAVLAAQLTPHVVWTAHSDVTTAADTVHAVKACLAAGASLVLFVGGDGTARDVCRALELERPGSHVAPGTQIDSGPVPALGIPAGVKMYSSCFAVSPSAGGALAAHWAEGRPLPLVEREVLDVDEEQLRQARVDPVLFGLVQIPDEPGRTQARKSPSAPSEEAMARSAAHGAVAAMRPGVHYLLGPGSTMARVAAELGVQKSPLGVDVVLDGRLVRADASESELLTLLNGVTAKAVVTVIGGQGFLLGRGNQQLSARVVDRLGPDPLVVVASEQKLLDLGGRPLIVDTGDPSVDARLAGYVRVITGATATTIYPVIAPEDNEGEHA